MKKEKAKKKTKGNDEFFTLMLDHLEIVIDDLKRVQGRLEGLKSVFIHLRDKGNTPEKSG